MSKKDRFQKQINKNFNQEKEASVETVEGEVSFNTENNADSYVEPNEFQKPAIYEDDEDEINIEDVEPLTSEHINYLKSIYPNLKLTMMVNQPIVWRAIPRHEYQLAYDLTEEERESISSLDPNNQISELMEVRNQKIVTYFVLFPSRPRMLYLIDKYSGIVPTLAEEILKGSGYSLQQPSIDL